MFTQKLSMDCTKEQYEKELKDELLKMGHEQSSASLWGNPDNMYIATIYGLDNTGIGNVNRIDVNYEGCQYLGSFNAPLFLALAAMTDKENGGYGEYWRPIEPIGFNDWH